MTTPFAKLFETEEYGQILVKLDASPDEHEPEVRFYVNPPGLGVCSFAAGYPDSDEGWDAAQACFDKCDLEMAVAAAKEVFEQTKGFRP